MKPFTKALIESGIVGKTVASLLTKWGSLTPAELEQLGQKQVVAETLEQFLEHLDELVEDHTFRATKLEISVKKPPISLYHPQTGNFSAVEDEMGRLIIDPLLDGDLQVGDHLWARNDMSTDPSLRILNIEELYQNDQVLALQLTVTKDTN